MRNEYLNQKQSVQHSGTLHSISGNGFKQSAASETKLLDLREHTDSGIVPPKTLF